MLTNIEKVEYIIMSRWVQLTIKLKQGTYTTNLTTDLINETLPDMNMTAEKLAIFLSELSSQRLNQTLQIQGHQLSVLVATLGKHRKIYLKCPLSHFQPSISPSLQSQHQACKRSRQANEKKIRELDDDVFQLKILVQQLNHKVAWQEEKLMQTLDFVKQEVEKCQKEYQSKFSELSIMIEAISEQKSSMIM